MRICIVVVYFGTWPNTFKLFFQSVQRNMDVDFLFVTDNYQIVEASNIKWVRTNLLSLRKRVSAVLGTPARLDTAYKVCDYRPMFGQIFAEYLEPYEYWGHSDIDMVFGRIRTFIRDDILASYDKVLVRGNFSLYRNSEFMNTLYLNIIPGVDWRRVVATDRSMRFDEWPGIYAIMRAKSVLVYMPEIILDINPKVWDLRRTRGDNVYPQVMYYEDGRIFMLQHGASEPREFLLIHMQKRAFDAPAYSVLTSPRIYFTPSAFVGGGNDALSRRKMIELNPRSKLGDVRITYRRAARKIRRIVSALTLERRGSLVR